MNAAKIKMETRPRKIERAGHGPGLLHRMAGLSRPSTLVCFNRRKEGVDGPAQAGHDAANVVRNKHRHARLMAKLLM